MSCARGALLIAVLGLLLCGVGSGLPSYAQPAPDQAAERRHVSVSEISLDKKQDNDKSSTYIQSITLDNGPHQFGLKKVEIVSKAGIPASELVGWDAPDQANWYHSGMFDLMVNGQSVNVEKSTFTILESGSRGVVDFTLDNKYGKFRCRFMVIPDSEVLFADFAIEPAVPVKSLVLRLHNYPGGFAIPREGKRHRQIIDSGGTLEPQSQPYALDPAANWWLFYQDAFLDKAIPENRKEAYGPSALILPGGEAQQVKITVGDYKVPTDIVYAPDRNHFRLAFLDYYGMTNKAALEAFARNRDQIRQTLESLVFLPQRLQKIHVTPPQITAEGLTGETAAAAAELKQLLDAFPAGNPWTQKTITSEDRTLQLLDQYDKARWHIVKQQRSGIAILVLQGLHCRYWKLDEAGKSLGKLLRETGISYYSNYYWKSEEISYFPSTWEEMSRYDVIVFANVPFTVLGPQRSQALAEYLQLGGSVLLLGGTYAYGQAGLDQPILGPLMPVQPMKVFDLQRFDKYQPLVKTPDAPAWLGESGINWNAGPQALWYHQIQPAPAAKVWLQVGGRPFLLTGSVGAGRVAAICAPPYGVAGKDDAPFWEWNSWQGVMARLLLWLGRGEAPNLPAL